MIDEYNEDEEVQLGISEESWIQRKSALDRIEKYSLKLRRRTQKRSRPHKTPDDFWAWGVTQEIISTAHPLKEREEPNHLRCLFCGELGGTLVKVSKDVYGHWPCSDLMGRGGL